MPLRVLSTFLLLLSEAVAIAQSNPEVIAAAVSSSRETARAAVAIATVRPSISDACARGELPRNQCRFRWRPALKQAGLFLAVNHTGNAIAQPSLRYELTHGNFFGKYADSLSRYRFSRWSDDDPFLVDYVGHPMMGAVTGRIQIQNDPAAMALDFGRSPRYWNSRLRALGFSTLFAFQWELGPLSESSIGNTGRYQYWSKTARKFTNGTGMTDLVTTPVAGTALLVGEDILDRYAVRRLENVSRHRAWLIAISLLNPCRSAANLLRWKAPWYRDSRPVPNPD